MAKKSRADICDGDDEASIRILHEALQAEGAELLSKDWAIGVDMYIFNIGDEEITVFIDTWSVDIEGSEEVVNRVRHTYDNMKSA